MTSNSSNIGMYYYKLYNICFYCSLYFHIILSKRIEWTIIGEFLLFIRVYIVSSGPVRMSVAVLDVVFILLYYRLLNIPTISGNIKWRPCTRLYTESDFLI